MRWDVEFSLALHNRTGKYHIGRELLDRLDGHFDRTWYWRLPLATTPRGMPARLIGRMLSTDHAIRRGGAVRPGRFRPKARLLHLDPFTVLHSRLRSSDGVLCHDIGPITHPDLFTPQVVETYRSAYRLIAQRRPRMVFASRSTADAFSRLYGRWGRFDVVYPPLRDIARDAGAPPTGVSAPFLLTVGSIGARKNQLRTIEAFARSGLADRGFSHVLCGAREPGAEAVVELARRTPGICLLPYVTDAELNWLYANAAGFVLMSRLEGFGMPVAEAVLRGLIPLVTEDGVLREVAGAGALAAPDGDAAAIARAMRELVDMSPTESRDRRQKLRSAVARFSEERFVADWTSFLTGSAE